ncbi:MAG: DUF881 domain-containing protein [Nocardioides sp.]
MTDIRDREYDTVERVTLPLLARITTQALDEDYAHVAQRRTQTDVQRRGLAWWVWLGVTVLVGGLLAVAGTQTSREAVDRQSSRTTLISRIDARRDVLAQAQERVGRVEAAASSLQTDLEGTETELDEVDAEVRRLRIRTGIAPVRGQGVRIVVDDSTSGVSAEAVRDEDLALLVNGLWTAGAEAIAINGQRLTVLSYIQNSGPAINVNSRPLVPPYTIEAIGDQRTLQAKLLESSSGARFSDLARLLGFSFERQNVDTLRLPGARMRRLRSAVTGQSGNVPKPVEEGGAP